MRKGLNLFRTFYDLNNLTNSNKNFKSYGFGTTSLNTNEMNKINCVKTGKLLYSSLSPNPPSDTESTYK